MTATAIDTSIPVVRSVIGFHQMPDWKLRKTEADPALPHQIVLTARADGRLYVTCNCRAPLGMWTTEAQAWALYRAHLPAGDS
jgi:hypothetical protein